MSDKAARHYLVSGKVQGVFYRASTAGFASSLNLSGTVKNLPDGRVEVFAQGDTRQLATLEQWLSKGPDLARVTEVVGSDALYDEAHSEFHVLR